MSNFFKARREQLGLSQTDVVCELRKVMERAGVKPVGTVGAVSGWERGQVPNVRLVDFIATTYRVSTRKIFDVMQEMARSSREHATSK